MWKTIQFGNILRGREALRCGPDAQPLIIASVGSSSSSDDLSEEIRKVQKAVSVGAHVVTDHSFYGDIASYHKALVTDVDASVSTVANYEVAAKARDEKMSFKNIGKNFILDLLGEQCARGIDLFTIHSSFKLEHLAAVNSSGRIIPTTSKGGGIISQIMRSTSRENPYYEFFDEILDILKSANACLSLGTTFRPATVCDKFDNLLALELQTMGELTRRAHEKGVAVMVEGIGHATLSEIPFHVQIAKQYCDGAPYRVLPMATDIALGYDHISGAISASHAIMAGADAITCISRAEHIGLPSEADLEEAVIATMIAVHCGTIARGGSLEKDRQMSLTRWSQGCKGDWTAAIYQEGAKAALQRYGRLNDQLIQCTMCGAYCGIAAGIATAKARK